MNVNLGVSWPWSWIKEYRTYKVAGGVMSFGNTKPSDTLVESLCKCFSDRGSIPLASTIFVLKYWYNPNPSNTGLSLCLNINFRFKNSCYRAYLNTKLEKNETLSVKVSFSYKFSQGGFILSHDFKIKQFKLLVLKIIVIFACFFIVMYSLGI